jgi:hypothetical protein
VTGPATPYDDGYPVRDPSDARVVSLVPSLTESVAVTHPEALAGATAWCPHLTSPLYWSFVSQVPTTTTRMIQKFVLGDQILSRQLQLQKGASAMG